MKRNIEDTTTEPEDIFGAPDYVDTPDIAKRMGGVKTLIEVLRANAALMNALKSDFSNKARL